MNTDALVSALESLLFASGEPLSLRRLAETLKIPEGAVAEGLRALELELAKPGCGLALLWKGKEVVLATRPENAEYVATLFKSELQSSISPAALETLAVIAYRGPITRLGIDAIRGVNSSFTLRNLLIRGLIDREGSATDARGYVYSLSFDFLREIGVSKVEDLPDYKTLIHDNRLESLAATISEEGAVLPPRDAKRPSPLSS